MVICLERGADLHMAQLMPLPLTVSASVKSRLVLPFWYRLTWVVPEKGPLNGCVYLLTATSTFELGRRRWNSPQQCHVSTLLPYRKTTEVEETFALITKEQQQQQPF